MALTDERIRDLWSWSMTAEAERTDNTQQHAFARAIESAACAERDAHIAKLTRALEKAERTLTAAGYTDEGGDLWKPPVKSK